MTTVFWPTTVAGLRQLRAAGAGHDLLCYSDTEEVYRAHELSADEEEDATFWAQTLAGVRSLLDADSGPRVVLAADVGERLLSAETGELGAVVVSDLAWTDAMALFVDEGDALEALARARKALPPGVDAAAASETAEVAALLEEHDLLWYLPSELDQLDD